MNFLELAGNLKGEDDLEILEEPPVKVNAPPDRGKGTSIVLSKRKARNNVVGIEKLMADTRRTSSSKRLAKIEIMEVKKMGKKTGSGMGVGTNRAFGPNWSQNEETMLRTPDQRAEWVVHALPPGGKNIFKYMQS